MVMKVQVSGYVTQEQKDKLAALAGLEDDSLSSIIGKLIDENYAINFPKEEGENLDEAND